MRSIRLRAACVLLASLSSAAPALAHPSVGIVEDSAGFVYYTDLSQVWRIAPGGTKSVAVAGVHTHELAIDGEDSLYGEHLWYEGDATKKWGHRIWKRSKDGVVRDIIPAREGFPGDYSFVRDRSGAMYWVDRSSKQVIKKRAPDGTIFVHSTGPFTNVRWMVATPDGIVYLVDQGRLLRLGRDGKVTTVVAALTAKFPPPSDVSGPHYQGGLFLGASGSVYVTVPGERMVLEVTTDGSTRVAARSSLLWAPYGGMIDRSGNLWLLETSAVNAVRVRRIDTKGKERVF